VVGAKQRGRNLVARLGADHFGVVLRLPGRGWTAVEDMLKASLSTRFGVQDAVLRVSATVGIALFRMMARRRALFTNARLRSRSQRSGQPILFYTPP